MFLRASPFFPLFFSHDERTNKQTRTRAVRALPPLRTCRRAAHALSGGRRCHRMAAAEPQQRAARRLRRRWRAHTAAAAAGAAAAVLALRAAPAAALAPPPPPPFTCLPSRNAASCAALSDLYSATDGAAWSNATAGWGSAAAAALVSGAPAAADYCAFEGVTCDAGGDITALCVLLRRPPAPWRRGGARRCCVPPQPYDERPRAAPVPIARCRRSPDCRRARCAPRAPHARSTLRGNLLVGSLPASLGDLSRLTTLCAPAAAPAPAWPRPRVRSFRRISRAAAPRPPARAARARARAAAH
jgi:hypothetical protein